MKSRTTLAVLVLLLTIVAAYGLDSLVWAIRGFPLQQMPVEVFSAMELKGQKEDYGVPESTLKTCQQRLLPTSTIPACWWLGRHREIVHRY